MWWWLLLIPALPATFFLWAAIHEGAHLLAARIAAPISSASMRLWPYRTDDGSWRWAESRWNWRDVPSLQAIGWVMLAPRLPNALGGMLLPGAATLPETWMVVVWTVVWAGGVADLAVGSMGIGANSDLRRAAIALDLSPWVMRIGGWTLVLISITGWLAAILVR